ncbi:restriction endonuclease subunit S, partial [Capnocytophaga sputigena]|uniref:restriction endonuclease subunit S n=1 Tax=Capnocytophaga sputigena TaxID=1019 RepID=UPI0028D64549
AFISKELYNEYKNKYPYPKKGDVLISAAGTIGRLVVFDGTPSYFQDSNIIWIENDENIALNKYLYHLYSNVKWKTTEGGIVSRLYNADVESLELPIPPLEEQEKIAEILLSCDKAIHLTTQIITQLKQRNQGLAQQLLTGEKRVKGFENSVWKEVRLGEIGSTYNGLTSKSKEDFGEGKPYIPYLNIFSNHIVDSAAFELVKIGVDDKQNKVIYGDILFTISSETPDEVGMSSVMLGNIDELYLNSFCFGFRLYSFDNLLPQYACYLFRNKDFREEIVRLAQGSTRFNLSKSEFLKTRVFLPTLTEQNAIAQILDTAHQELKLYEQKLQLLQAQKKTLMQKLLTGEVLTIKK